LWTKDEENRVKRGKKTLKEEENRVKRERKDVKRRWTKDFLT